MRTLLLASTAALMVFGAGVSAQTTTAPGTSADTTMPMDPSAPVPPAGDQSSPTAPSAPMPPSPSATPDATMPGGSAAGAPMGSPSSPAAPGATGATPPMAPMTTPPPPPPRTDYPLCSKTVTDSCINPGEAHGKGRAKRR